MTNPKDTDEDNTVKITAGFRMRKALNNRIFACPENSSVAFKCVGELFTRSIKNKDATVVKAILLQDVEARADYEMIAAGENVQIILPAVAVSLLEGDGQAVTDRCFYLTVGTIEKGTAFRRVTMFEIDPE